MVLIFDLRRQVIFEKKKKIIGSKSALSYSSNIDMSLEYENGPYKKTISLHEHYNNWD